MSGERARAKGSLVNFPELWVNHGCRREASASEEGRAAGNALRGERNCFRDPHQLRHSISSLVLFIGILHERAFLSPADVLAKARARRISRERTSIQFGRGIIPVLVLACRIFTTLHICCMRLLIQFNFSAFFEY